MADGTIVVTNDDGIESPGLKRLVEALEPLGEVIVVAPATNQSAVGRSIEATAEIEEHHLGYAVNGSPSTCVIAAETALDLNPDVVVSGINKGANLGATVLSRSGTVGAAIEAAYLDIPAIAVSGYVPFERIQGDFHEFTLDSEEYVPAAFVARRIASSLLQHGRLDGVDYLNVNSPLKSDLLKPEIQLTTPAPGYHTAAELEDEQLILRDRQFELLHTGDLVAEGTTDRSVLSDGYISVSPLALSEQVPSTRELESIGQALFGDGPWHITEPAD